ncbi:hypothetical protein WR25_21175 [Diploscapter pachys]|uniref:AB hydrolase-1 domain-containing protein n=1 Tax=Diploscapter pachys TaxID=2018661 RepID=A0A2A2LDD8_9BILA|nr:hypothetical protein WR25_21175 [Diploscapter pachys]
MTLRRIPVGIPSLLLTTIPQRTTPFLFRPHELAQAKRAFFTRIVHEPLLKQSNPEAIKALTQPDGSVKLPDSEEKKPVILLLGWAGADEKHLWKYASFYNEAGYRVCLINPSCYHPRIPNSRVGFYMSPLFQAVKAKPGDFTSYAKCPIIVHLFSMNGVRCLVSFWQWTEAEQKAHLRNRIKGIIFDSAPTIPRGSQEAKAVVMSTPKVEGPLQSWISDETRTAFLHHFFNFRNGIMHTFGNLFPKTRSLNTLYYYLRDNMQLPSKQLYIYSTIDDMIREKYVIRFIENQQSLKKDVTVLRYEDSPHVAHFRTDPKKYRAACLEHVHRIEQAEA